MGVPTYYDIEEIGGFPQRLKPATFRPALTDKADVPTFDGIYDELSKLTLAVYAPLTYVQPSRRDKYAQYDTATDTNVLKQTDRESSIKALMRINLLKRLESSVEAFRLTLSRLSATHHATLASIARFERGGSAGYAFEIERSDDEDDVPTELERGQVRVAFEDMDLVSYRHDLEGDIALIDGLLAEMERVAPEDDKKLQHLIEFVRHKLEHPINAGNGKLLIFTAFADTAEYLPRDRAADREGGRAAFCDGHRIGRAKDDVRTRL